MPNRIPMLVIVGLAPLLVVGTLAQAQDRGLSRTCRFTSGPRAGSTVDFANSPGSPEIPIGAHCGDMNGSNGRAVIPLSEGGRLPGSASRFYHSPSAPMGLSDSGESQRGFTFWCRFASGPRAGATADFSRTLGATPIPVGARCSDGSSRGVGVSFGRR